MKVLVVGEKKKLTRRIENLLKRVVSPDGKMFHVSDTKEGLEVLKKERMDVVVVDYKLPDITGVEFIERIRREGFDIPAILVVGKGVKIKEETARQIGCDFVISEQEYRNALPFVIEAAYNRYLFDSERRSKGEILSVMSEEIIKSKEQWQATIDAVTDYIFVIDRDSKIRRTNVSFATRFKRHPRDMIGMKIDTLLGIDMSYGDSPFKEVFASNTPVSRELRIGDETFIVNIFPAMFDDDEVAVCIMKDVTETKRLREQLYHSDKLASIGLLVSGVAHEINNPLTGVLGYAEMLLSITKEDKTQKYLYKIYNAAERCKKFVETLLCFSRQQKSQHSLENINDIIDRTLEVRTYWFRSNNVEILKNYGNVPLVYIDAQQMQQVMLNILINAEQAIDSYNQCGRIVLSTAYDEKNKKIIIKVSDNGPGIPAKHLDMIFDPFFTTKPADKGTGLGLSIARGIVEEHGGSIRAESQEGQGATFIIELPVD